ncbi:MAG: Gfo/Idh/MocA family oxidoreductase [Chloroflexota bacterium]
MSTPEPIRVGMIGVGQIGKAHVNTYSQMDNVEMVALADLNVAEGNRVAEMNGIPNVYTDFRKMLERDDIQAVDVCLHNNFHMPVTVAALEAGKDVFCEKPMAGAYTDAEKMLETARSLGRKLGIQVRNIFLSDTKAAKYMIDEGHLGKLYHARSTGYRRRGRPFVDGYGTPTFVQKHNSGGGALYDMGVYHINTILYLLDNPEVLRVTGKTYQETDMDANRREISGYNVEELGLGFVRFEENMSLDIIEAWAIHIDEFESPFVVGSKGGVRVSPFSFHQSIGDLDLSSTANMGTFDYRLHNVHGQGDTYDGPQQHWIAGLQGRVEPIPTAEIALNTMLISEGIYLSEKLGREVTAEEIREMSVSTAVSV